MAFFSPDERGIALALAGAAMPPGKILPGAGEETIARLEARLAALPAVVQVGFRTFLWGLEFGAVATQGGRFTSLPLGRRLRALEWADSLEPSSVALRAALALFKAAWLDDPALHRALGCRYAVEPPAHLEPARWRNQMVDASALPDGEVLECDVVVVGSGAGGAPMALALAERGLAVLILEEGQYFSRVDFTGRPFEMMRKLYRRGGLTVSLGNRPIVIPYGRAVGGTTLINSGTCFRVPDSTLAEWRDVHGLPEFTPDALAPFYDQVESFLEVGPSSPGALGKPAELIARGCDALGYSHHPLRRNAPGCDGQGICCFGCPTDAKRSTNISYVPAALDRGAQLVTGVRVDAVLMENGSAAGVSGTVGSGGGGRRVEVRAKAVVLACGSLGTPVLLLTQRLANGSGQVGRNLSIHPAAAAMAVFDEPVNSWNTVPQGYAIDEFKDEGLYYEGASAPLEVTGVALPGYGPSWVALMEDFPRSLLFGFMVKDTSRGSVWAGPDGEALITYWLNGTDLAQVRRGLGILARVYFAAGAREVHLPIVGSKPLHDVGEVATLEQAPLAARLVDLSAHHPLGTCRMGPDAGSSVVGPTHETHDVKKLFICDGSAVPSSLGVNPQITIMAMALRAAEFVTRSAE